MPQSSQSRERARDHGEKTERVCMFNGDIKRRFGGYIDKELLLFLENRIWNKRARGCGGKNVK